jgi:hypothetical protein
MVYNGSRHATVLSVREHTIAIVGRNGDARGNGGPRTSLTTLDFGDQVPVRGAVLTRRQQILCRTVEHCRVKAVLYR